MKPGEKVELSEDELASERELCIRENEERLALGKRHTVGRMEWWKAILATKRIAPECVIVFDGKDLLCMSVND